MKKSINPNNKKLTQLSKHTKDHSEAKLTTNQGVGIANTDDSLKGHSRGPTLLEDFHFREKVTHFDHERIPERVVHARGSGAHGYFQAYECLSDYTCASFLQDPKAKTPVFVRFSTVVGSRGSADTVRDVRGFATKFYTDDGVFDLVGNNMPVFFIQDAIKFPDIVHAIKPEPDREIPQASSAHDTLWDFVVNTPETAHMIMWLMSDRALPRSFRMMEGFGVNTYKLINAEGQARFVKFHWKPKLGVHSLVWDETQKIAGKDPDFNRRDLFDEIFKGNYPEFELGIQVIEAKDEFKFDFDILDPTKLWPEEEVPVQLIGKMTLNANPTNFFAETEQVAFCPTNIVKGIDFSNDPLLQGRLFSYLDTQLIRLGGPNFHEIPINKPINPINNNQRDGYHRMTIDMGKVSYLPNSMMFNNPHTAKGDETSYAHHQEKVDGIKIRTRSESFKDFFSQAILFWNSMSTPEKKHIIDAFSFEVGKVMDMQIRQKVVDMFNNVDGDLATQIAQAIGVKPPQKPFKSKPNKVSYALSQENTPKSPETRKIAILVEEGFNKNEVDKVISTLNDNKACYDIISCKQGNVKASDGKMIQSSQQYITTSSVLYDAIYVPGGKQSVDKLKTNGDAKHFVNEAFKHAKAISASNEAVDFLASTEIQGVKLADNKSSNVFSDCGVVTIRNNDITKLADEFIVAVSQHRHWCRNTMKGSVPA